MKGNDERENKLGINPGGRIFNTPQLPAEIYNNLPESLRESAKLFQDAVEKDVFLIGSIAVLSGCLPNIEGIYFDEPHTAHLYAFITAPAGSGKGKMKWSRYFGQAIHESMVESSKSEREDYELKMKQYNILAQGDRLDEVKPEQPPRKMFFIPANSSSTAFIQALADNNCTGVIFETEADTLANTFKQEWGNFSDVLRKAFHHESTSLFRRKDSEFIEIESPHLAIALSGTPKQVQHIMPDVENGLFSRFLYYSFENDSDFKNPFLSHQKVDYTLFFKEQGRRIFRLYQRLSRLKKPVGFSLTSGQAIELTVEFDLMLKRNKLLLGNDFEANIKRLGLIGFRIAMVLSALRLQDDGEELPKSMICNDTDFKTAMTITKTLERHAIAVYRSLPNNELKGNKLRFWEALPEKFNRQIYLKIADDLDIGGKMADKYIGQFKEKLLGLEYEYNRYCKTGNRQ